MTAILNRVENKHRGDREQTECREPIHFGRRLVEPARFDHVQGSGYVGRS
jgi:hypothetical protein